MKKVEMSCLCGTLAGWLVVAGFANQALAVTAFKNEFFETYVKENPSTAVEKTFAEAANAKTGKCWVCHVNMSKYNPPETGLGKKVRNNYGKAISGLLKKDDFSSERRKAEPDKVKAEIQAALKKVAAMKSNPDDPKSPTFGELIASGKLPGDSKPNATDLKKAIAAREAEE